MSTATIQVIADNERNVTVKATLAMNAVEFADTLLVDISTLTGTFTEVKIMAVQAGLEGFGVELIWDATSNVSILDIPGAGDFDQNYRKFGGLINNAGAGKTGDILISSSGAAVNLTGAIVLELRKRG